MPDNRLTPIWEPFLRLYNDQLICFYSDQRDPAHGQKLTHQTTSDLQTWDANVDDVAYGDYNARPGMTTVSSLPDGRWIMTYEYGNAPDVSFAAFYKVADSPLEFGAATGCPVVGADGSQPVSSPYNVWVPRGGANGTIIMNAASESDLYINTELAAPGSRWTRKPSGLDASYTRSLTPIKGNSELLIMGGGSIDTQLPNHNSVTYAVDSLSALTGYF